MDKTKTCLQRAFELARSGECLKVTDIIMRLKAERFDIAQIEGPALKKQLIQLIKTARQSVE